MVFATSNSEKTSILYPMLGPRSKLLKITMIGQGKKFEIWGNNTWESKVSKWRTEETDESEDTVLGDIRI